MRLQLQEWGSRTYSANVFALALYYNRAVIFIGEAYSLDLDVADGDQCRPWYGRGNMYIRTEARWEPAHGNGMLGIRDHITEECGRSTMRLTPRLRVTRRRLGQGSRDHIADKTCLCWP
ncbi:uncharacterized protein MYCFIDRAFT_172377 [Pseudocercospora fijiensis CIRAD86]|uniref:Uncharacterized protein n=1 Tax=Pseudocercospora fijiensis (strain CIRAD86) TaxID=383855 RepID=M3APY8_PSEFD|nr:uncharacterized protein MYCFIDRAFT_172377 [Pseudocercospora fijiensis CIRAD86]EME86671.1 hypothetical protein MYCFIDRAFT_172377 [Pseudocercospora fijiensis CIRAD86]